MVNELIHLLRERNVLWHRNSGVLVCTVSNQKKGFDLAAAILYKIIDRQSVLYLSGGRTPKEFYEKLAREESLIPGAVGMVDERYGAKFYENSNERMIRETGFLRYLEMRDVAFYSILQPGLSREEAARKYDARLRSLLSTFREHIGILGIGVDGHTAGIAGNRKDFRNPIFDAENKDFFVSEFDDRQGSFKERVTMTFLGLSMLDALIVLVFGEGKREALQMVFGEEDESQVPGRFYAREEIAKKTVLITDQG
jgi:6-phosphogluconolactonase/glucosamine-6-phosphate isomerase/deaminase